MFMVLLQADSVCVRSEMFSLIIFQREKDILVCLFFHAINTKFNF